MPLNSVAGSANTGRLISSPRFDPSCRSFPQHRNIPATLHKLASLPPSGGRLSHKYCRPVRQQDAKQCTSATCENHSVMAASTVSRAVATDVVLKQCELSFGDKVKAVGDTGQFGSWDVNSAPELAWQEGHNWQTQLELAPGTCTFKLVIVQSDGRQRWEAGDNRSALVPGDVSGGQVTIACQFDQTAFTEVQVTPAAAAQEPLTPNLEEDVVDEFAAGDAAPQTEAKHQSNGANGANGQKPSVMEDNLIDEFAAGDAAAQVQGVQQQADEVQQHAEVSRQTGDATEQSTAAAVKQEIEQNAPKEDLKDTLSVLQDAENDLEQQQPSQSSQSSPAKAETTLSATPVEAKPLQDNKQESAGSPDASSKSQGLTELESFPTFGKSKVSGVARDGSITFTFEEDDDTDLQALTSQILGL